MNTCDFGRIDLVQYSIGTGYLRTFALKCLVKADIADQGLQTCILKEKKILLHCRSPFIVRYLYFPMHSIQAISIFLSFNRLYKTFKDSKYVYFLQEACLGGDLKQKLNVNGYFDDETVKFITACVVEALNYLHSRQILYNNLRKENLVLDGRGYVKLV